jgi:hypothetical protein
MEAIKLILLLTLISSIALAKLPELQTKQELPSLRFLTQDGKISFYKKYTGGLEYSSNYLASTLFKLPKTTDYRVTKNLTSQEYLITVIENQFYDHNLRADYDIFYVNLKSGKPKLIGKGVAPKFHLKGKYFSYYSHQQKKIIVTRKSDNQNFHIVINNKSHPYFIPDIQFLNNEFIVFNDYNDKNTSVVLLFSKLEKTFQKIYSAQSPGSRFEFCIKDQELILASWPYLSVNQSSQIFKIPTTNNEGFKKKVLLYESPLQDIGQLICDEKNIFFIKTIDENKKLNYKTTEVASLNLQSKKVSILSDLQRVSNLFTMDGRILSSYRKKMYVVKGKSQSLDDSIGEKVKK